MLIGLFLLPFAARAERVEDLPQPTSYVSDFAHVLSPATSARIEHLCAQLATSKAKAKIAVVTVRSLEGDDASSYANRLEDHWKMGDKGENRFALILLATGDHKYRIETGYGLEGILPDGKVGDIGREMVPYLRRADYDSALSVAASEVAGTVVTDAHVTLSEDGSAADQRPVRHKASLVQIILIVIFVLFFGGIGLLWLLASMGIFGGFGGGGFGGGGFGGWGGGGGFGGGGDSGGGFSGFGGDGGGFGGGGAGGDW